VTPKAPDLSCTVGKWNEMVRRARLTAKQKLAALIVSSYADADGTGIHCGVARLAADMQATYRTARRYLAWLREVGLIELVRAGNRRRGWSDEYRLILGPDVLEHLEVPDPTAYEDMMRGLKAANQGTSMVSPDDTRSERRVEAPPEVLGDIPMCPPVEAIRGQNEVDQGTSLCVPPPSLTTSPKDLPPLKTSDGDLQTASHPSRAHADEPKPPSVVVEIFPGASKRPPVGGRRWSDAAMEAVAEASVRRAAAVAAHRAGQEAQ
jgi:DNA-binding transcriptional ArsR family regulator